MTFFQEPPRPRGRGWRRRLQAIFGWWSIGGFFASLLTIGAVYEWSERARSRRLAREGERTICTVVSKRSTTGKNTSYYVTLRSDLPPYWSVERSVESREWNSVTRGSKTVMYHDPGRASDGVSELERPGKEGVWLPIFLSLLSSGLWLAVLARTWRLVQEMGLLRTGIELVTRGTAEEVRIVAGERETRVRFPRSLKYLVQVGESGRVRGVVVLASPDLKRFVFPTLEDVPVEKIVRGEETQPVLPPPVRPGNDAWKNWLKRKHSTSKGLTGILGGIAAILMIVGAFVGIGPLIGGLVVTAVFGFALLIHLRNYWRDRVLWREGEELHAVVLHQQEVKSIIHCRFSYSYGNREYRGSEHLPSADAPRTVPSPEGAAAVADRVVILVDPYRPTRCVIVPVSIS